MFCGKCGFNNPDTETVCQGCGVPIEAPAAPAAAPYAPPMSQPGYPQAPYGYPQQTYQAPPRKPFFDGPFNSAGWWESAARLASYIVGGWSFISAIIYVAVYSSSYGYSISAWSAISNILSAIIESALTIAVVTLITFVTKYLRENSANTKKLVELKEQEAAKNQK